MEAVKTYVHLTDGKRWFKTIEHPGDYSCGNIYMERRVIDYTKAFGELVPDDHKYHFQCVFLDVEEGVGDVKHMFFKERLV